ncbi:MAG: CPBP family intramembrane metalloprotease [Chitinophagales bacterium]|nr:CPBP family intramembrane metalloprotease [Chitinophagales bacterium]
MQDAPDKSIRAILTFLLITFSLSAAFYLLIIHTGKIGSGFGLYVTGLMWCPGLSALITSRILNRKISLLGWQWGNTRLQVWSYLVPFLYALIAYSVIWAVGWGGFYNHDYVKAVTDNFGFGTLPTAVTIAFFFILGALYGLPSSCATALGEEIGWRGFLVPELYKKLGYTKTAIVAAIIWALWHYPILLFADYNSGTSACYALSCFTAMVIGLSFIFTWFRLRSGSLWTGVLLHGSHNLFIQMIFTPLTADTGNTKYYVDEFGAVLPVVCLLFAVYFWTKRHQLSPPQQAIDTETQ